MVATDVFCVYNMIMAKRGRPRKNSSERLEWRLDLRVSESDKKIFLLAADHDEQELSVWIRMQLHRAAADQVNRQSSGTTEKNAPTTS